MLLNRFFHEWKFVKKSKLVEDRFWDWEGRKLGNAISRSRDRSLGGELSLGIVEGQHLAFFTAPECTKKYGRQLSSITLSFSTVRTNHILGQSSSSNNVYIQDLLQVSWDENVMLQDWTEEHYLFTWVEIMVSQATYNGCSIATTTSHNQSLPVWQTYCIEFTRTYTLNGETL
jgi:hypothetical protein